MDDGFDDFAGAGMEVGMDFHQLVVLAQVFVTRALAVDPQAELAIAAPAGWRMVESVVADAVDEFAQPVFPLDMGADRFIKIHVASCHAWNGVLCR